MSKQSAVAPMNLRMTVYSALFTTLIIIGGVNIPIGPVPIVLADFFVMLAGLFLGPKWGLASVLLWLFLGVLGLPVFAGFKAGLAVLMGPTAGFLPGYVLMVLAVGLLAGIGKPSWARNTLALIVGNILLYPPGILWLKMLLHLNWPTVLAAYLLPFLPGTVIKIVVAVALGQTLLPRFKQAVSEASWQPANDNDEDEQ
ncbi:MAG: biotin transporter BioY [Firmicutes bacterium]|nr:biotin transporter BioY [Bacillota bacterium]